MFIKKSADQFFLPTVNSQLEVYDEATLVSGLNLTHALDDLLGVKRKTVLSQRDVPSTTAAIIPILKQNGVDTLSIGSNGGSTPPNVPPFFSWKSPDLADEIRVMYHWGGYGGVNVPSSHHVVNQIPGTSEAVVIHWGGDNGGNRPPPLPRRINLIHDHTGPPDVTDVQNFFAAVAQQHPGAQIVSSSFEQVAEILRGLPPHVLPVLSKEMGDVRLFAPGGRMEGRVTTVLSSFEVKVIFVSHSEGVPVGSELFREKNLTRIKIFGLS